MVEGRRSTDPYQSGCTPLYQLVIERLVLGRFWTCTQTLITPDSGLFQPLTLLATMSSPSTDYI